MSLQFDEATKKHKQKTKTINDSFEPEWNEEIVFSLHDSLKGNAVLLCKVKGDARTRFPCVDSEVGLVPGDPLHSSTRNP